jgi:hypothetical protein
VYGLNYEIVGGIVFIILATPMACLSIVALALKILFLVFDDR